MSLGMGNPQLLWTASQLTPVTPEFFFNSQLQPPKSKSFSSSTTKTSALLPFKSRSLECGNLLQVHPNKHLHHLSQPVLQPSTHSPSFPNHSGHTPSFWAGKLPCSPLPGILASLHWFKSSLLEARSEENRRKTVEAKVRALEAAHSSSRQRLRVCTSERHLGSK